MATGRHSPSADIEDFLYHVYKGSESLADGRLDSARASIDSALRIQPKDPAAQDLLGKLYFKLGVYPRAIELYQEIVKQFPDSLPPRINLALAYLKTAQLREAIAHLLPVIERDPNHVRAWGYLGLCWSRLSEYAKAKEAFVRAGHDAMALRMEQALEAQYGAGSSPYHQAVSPNTETPRVVESEEIDTSVLDPGVLRVAPDTETAPGRWTMHAHGDPIVDARQVPSTLAGWASKHAFAPLGRTIEELQQTVVAHEGCAIRSPKSAFGMGWTRGHAVRRRDGEPIDGDAPLLWVVAGWCAVPRQVGQWRVLIALRDEGLIVMERHVLAFDGGLHMEPVAGREHSLPALSFVGYGIVALYGSGGLCTLECSSDAPVSVHIESLVSFSPGMVHSLEGSMITLKGEGLVVVQTTTPNATQTLGETR